MNIKNRMYTDNRKLKAFLTEFCILLSALLFITCSQSSESGEDLVTFSGTVTIEDTTDHSGVKVMLFKPIEIDTALTNLNNKYPGIGIEINQRTEFYWREHSPAYQTTTESSGNWKIEGVAPGEYHIVTQVDTYGWKVLYSADKGQYNIEMEKVITLKGAYSDNILIPNDSFVKITGNTVINNNVEINIGNGTVIEFDDNYSLTIYGELNSNGQEGNEIYFVPKDTAKNVTLKLEQSNNTEMHYVYFFKLENGIYIRNCGELKISNCRFISGYYALDVFDTDLIEINNTYISNSNDGLKITECNNYIYENIIINSNNSGIQIISCDSSKIQNNIINNTYGNALDINPATGYQYNETHVLITYNDFKNNHKHVYAGQKSIVTCNYCNFLFSTDFHVRAHNKIEVDTLNFKFNYWGTTNIIQISDKIDDKLDRLDKKGPVVDFSDFSYEYIDWIEML